MSLLNTNISNFVFLDLIPTILINIEMIFVYIETFKFNIAINSVIILAFE